MMIRAGRDDDDDDDIEKGRDVYERVRVCVFLHRSLCRKYYNTHAHAHFSYVLFRPRLHIDYRRFVLIFNIPIRKKETRKLSYP